MHLILQSIFCGCLLATIAPGVDSAKHDLKRSVPAVLRILDNIHFVRSDNVKDILRSHPSTDISIRTKRSNDSTNNTNNQSRRRVCPLGECTLNDLIQYYNNRYNRLTNRNQPADKISSFGHGEQ